MLNVRLCTRINGDRPSARQLGYQLRYIMVSSCARYYDNITGIVRAAVPLGVNDLK